MKTFIYTGRTGCLIPSMAVLNLFFGWLFLPPKHWVLLEAVLVIVALFQAALFGRRVQRDLDRSRGIIDVEGAIVEEGGTKKAIPPSAKARSNHKKEHQRRE